MAVQQEIKSQLAKLLATEDLVVEHKDVPTAQFNVHTRELLLPMWEKASNHVYDMLVGHEVGHALFTPDDWSWEGKIPQQFVNVCEDARIEKLMKRKYMGIAKSFYRGYSELHDKDFFEVKDEDLSTFNLADRANLYFKIGSFLDLSFSDAEKEIITLIQNAETFTETIAAAEALYSFCQQETKQKTQELPAKSEEGLGEDLVNEQSAGDSAGTRDTDADSTDDIDSSLPDSDSNDSLEGRNSSPNYSSGMDDSGDSLEDGLKTVSSLEDKLRKLTNTRNGLENEYIEIPKVNLDSVIINNEEVHNLIEDHWDAEYQYRYDKYHDMKKIHGDRINWHLDENCFEVADIAYKEFKKEAQKEVNYLVKEFECKKSASAYARAATSKTGVLDTSKLHTYKFNEDLFKKITVLPTGKNHGLIFILDWSGSMSTVIKDTIKQLYNLIWFCKKVNIPFEVYAFTYEWFRAENIRDYTLDADERREARKEKPDHCERKENEFHIEKEFNLMNLFTSNTNGKTLEKQLLNIWRIATSFGYGTSYNYPPSLALSGTPLNESLIALHEIIPLFQKRNKVEKVQCIMLTDGEANSIPYNRSVERHWEDEPFMGCASLSGERSFIRDRKLGKTYKVGYGYFEFTNAILRNMQDKFPNTNFIGIRILAPRDAKYFIRMHGNDEQAYTDWSKSRTFTIKTAGYDAYFGLSSTALADDTEFDVDDGATKAQIKRAFVKSLKTKKLNKKVLGEFISLVV